MTRLDQRLRKLEGNRGSIHSQLESLSDEELELQLAEAEEEMFPCLMEGAAAELLASLGIPNPIDLEAWRGLDSRTQERILDTHIGPDEVARLARI